MTSIRAGLSREETNKSTNLLKYLERLPESYEFRHPVDYIGLGLPDYPDIVKVPMDLSTVKKLLKSGEYQTIQDFLLDIQLIWDNCKLYNPEESIIYQQAVKLQETVHSYCVSNSIQIPTGKRRNREPTVSLQDKKDLSEQAKRADVNTLAHICLVVKQECPEAYTENTKTQVVIDIEKINYSTFVRLKE